MYPKAKGDYINGRFVRRRSADLLLTVRDPSCAALLGEFPLHDEAIAEAVASARAAFPKWAVSAPSERVAALKRLGAQLQNRAEELAWCLSSETGRPHAETRTELEALGLQTAWVSRAIAPPSLTTEQGNERDAQLSLHPRGIVAVIASTRDPLQALHQGTVSALAAGCTVVCKPCPEAPAVGQLYAEVLHAAGLPKGCFNLIQGEAAADDELALAAIDVLVVSGAPGKLRRLSRLLERRGPTPPSRLFIGERHALALVLGDAELERAVEGVTRGALLSTGQRSTNTRALLVHKSIARAFFAQLVERVWTWRLGDPFEATHAAGPLASEQALRRYERYRARCLARGEPLPLRPPVDLPKRGYFVGPTLVRCEAEQLAQLLPHGVGGPLLLVAEIEDYAHASSLAETLPSHRLDTLFCAPERQRERLELWPSLPGCASRLFNRATTEWPTALALDYGPQAAPLGYSPGPLQQALSRRCLNLSLLGRSDALLDTDPHAP